MVKTENAQFIYMVKFHEMTAERLKRLDEIEQERQGLENKPENYGKLQDNTNKLLALNTRMELDEAQMQSAMNAYDTRLAYLRTLQAQKTEEALSGKKASDSGTFDALDKLKGVVLGGGLLAATLCAEQKVHWGSGTIEDVRRRRMKWNESEGGVNAFAKLCPE